MHKTILIPIDMAQLDKAKPMIDLASTLSTKDTLIILLNVIEIIPDWVTAALPANILGEPRQSARDELTAIANAAAFKADIEVRTGHPYRTILEVADETRTDLIIVASHKPELQDYLLGSTAARVVRHAKCSVYVMR